MKEVHVIEKKECGKKRNSFVANEFSETKGVAASNDDSTSNGPDVEWEQKLQLCLPVSIQSNKETSFNSKVQIEPGYKKLGENVNFHWYLKGRVLGPYNVGIKDESINEFLSNNEVECKYQYKEHKKDTISSKDKQECHFMVIGTFNAPKKKSNYQAKVVYAGIQ